MNKNVTVIEPILKSKSKLRIAAYVRVSSKSEDQENSFNAQMIHYQKSFAYDPNTELVEIYADEGITGTSLKKRGDFLRMLYDARDHKFDRIVVKSVTRFGRNVVDSLNALRELEKEGISVFFEMEGLDTSVIKGELLQTVLLALAQDESERKSADAKRAGKMRKELGIYHPGTELFGYDIDKELKNYVINEEEAKMKQTMMNMYLNGYSSEEIADHLNEIGFLPYDKKKWQGTHVINYLKNEKNFGDVCINKFVSEGFPAKEVKNTNIDTQKVLVDHHDAIFDREEESDFNKILNYRKQKLNTYCGKKMVYPYTEKLKCGYCNSNLIRRIAYKGKPYETVSWGCSVHVKEASKCELKNIKEKELDELFVRMFNKLRLNYEQIILPYLADLNRLKLTVQEQKRVNEISLEILELKKQSQSLTKRRVSGEIDSAFYYSMLNEIETKRYELSNERSTIYSRFEKSLDMNRTKVLLEIVENYPGTMDKFESAMFVAIVRRVKVTELTVVFELFNGFVFEEWRKVDD